MTDEDPRVDALLRQWGEQQRKLAGRAGDGPAVARTDRRRVGLLAVAAAAGVVLVAGGAIALRDTSRTPGARTAAPSTPGGPTTLRSTISTPRTPPPQTQLVTFHSLAVTVPATWKVDDERCGFPQSNTVLLPDGAVGACMAGRPSGITWVEFGSSGHLYRPVTHAHTRNVVVGGHLVEEISGRAQDNAVVFVYVRAAGASAAIYSPSARRAQRIADTLSVVEVDGHGCVTRAPYGPLPAIPPPTRPGARDSLIPGRPTSMVVCGYDVKGLGGSGEVPAQSLAADLAMLRSLPRGYSIARGNPDSNCTSPTDPASSLDRDDVAWYAVLVHYDQGPPLVLHARIGGCGYLGITNGAVSAQRGRFELAGLLIDTSHVSAGFPEYVVPAPR